MVIEAGVVTGYVIAWAMRKARRAAGRLDTDVDAVIGAGLDQLHEVVTGKLGSHPVLGEVQEETATGDGQVSELTRQQLELALTAAARKDDAFGQALTDLLVRIRAGEQAAGVQVMAGAGSRVFTGDAHADAAHGGIAFGQVGGDIHLDGSGRDPTDPPAPGRSSH